MKKFISWDKLDTLVDELCDMIPENQYEGIYAIPRGGLIIGVMMSHKLGYRWLIDLNFCKVKKF